MDSSLETYNIPGTGSFQFSAIRPENLGATEYTLVSIVLDISGSVEPYAPDLLKMVQTSVLSCKKSPRAENLLIRLTTFNNANNISEIHGFKLLNSIDPNDYKPFQCYGVTALFDATYEAICSMKTYSKTLMDQEFNVNGITFVITDGEDNDSKVSTPKKIKKENDELKKAEVIESSDTILIRLNAAGCKPALDRFFTESGFSQNVDLGDVTPQKLAKLAGFVSKSISSTSQALGTGTASQPITMTF